MLHGIDFSHNNVTLKIDLCKGCFLVMRFFFTYVYVRVLNTRQWTSLRVLNTPYVLCTLKKRITGNNLYIAFARDDFERNIVAWKIDACNMALNLLQRRCKNLKPVQSCAPRCGNNVALKLVSRRYVTRINRFLCSNIAFSNNCR